VDLFSVFLPPGFQADLDPFFKGPIRGFFKGWGRKGGIFRGETLPRRHPKSDSCKPTRNRVNHSSFPPYPLSGPSPCFFSVKRELVLPFSPVPVFFDFLLPNTTGGMQPQLKCLVWSLCYWSKGRQGFLWGNDDPSKFDDSVCCLTCVFSWSTTLLHVRKAPNETLQFTPEEREFSPVSKNIRSRSFFFCRFSSAFSSPAIPAARPIDWRKYLLSLSAFGVSMGLLLQRSYTPPLLFFLLDIAGCAWRQSPTFL